MRALAPLPRAVAATAAASAAASPRAFPGGFLHSFSFPRGSSANPPLRLSDGRRAERNSGAGGRRTTVMASESAAAGNGSAAAYADVLAAAESAVRLACALCETVQRGLKAEESASKSDESPVTIADYGALTRGPWGVREWGVGSAEWGVGSAEWAVGSAEWAALGVVAPPVRIDSQAKYGAMARGDAAIYMRFPPDGYREKIWDHAAGSLVISEAGGQVCDASGQPLDFSRGRFLDLDTGIIATNATLMHVLLSTVQSALNR
ncbi:unnamed protein product [Closterium sp. NIES-54]